MKPLVDRAKNRGQLEIDSILATFGLMFIMQGVMLLVFGGQYFTYNFLSEPVRILGENYGLNRIVALGAAHADRAGALSVSLSHALRHGGARRFGQPAIGKPRRHRRAAHVRLRFRAGRRV
jgi:branched-chain amino acid transport system permease protein